MATLQPVFSHRDQRAAQTGTTYKAPAWWHELLWVPAAAGLGFGVSAIGAGWLELARSWLVLVYALAATPLILGYLRWAQIDPIELVRRRWVWGVAGALVISPFLVLSVMSQDSTARPEGLALVGNLLWFGVVYGLLDALVLSVLPVLATWRAFSHHGWTERWRGRIGTALLAVAASLLVTAVYHLGYPEFRGADLRGPIVGNTVMSIGYVVTGNPLTAIISHVVMHIAAVLQGAEGTTQLPPHY